MIEPLILEVAYIYSLNCTFIDMKRRCESRTTPNLHGVQASVTWFKPYLMTFMTLSFVRQYSNSPCIILLGYFAPTFVPRKQSHKFKTKFDSHFRDTGQLHFSTSPRRPLVNHKNKEHHSFCNKSYVGIRWKSVFEKIVERIPTHNIVSSRNRTR